MFLVTDCRGQETLLWCVWVGVCVCLCVCLCVHSSPITMIRRKFAGFLLVAASFGIVPPSHASTAIPELYKIPVKYQPYILRTLRHIRAQGPLNRKDDIKTNLLHLLYVVRPATSKQYLALCRIFVVYGEWVNTSMNILSVPTEKYCCFSFF